jgi:hypothetical protein
MIHIWAGSSSHFKLEWAHNSNPIPLSHFYFFLPLSHSISICEAINFMAPQPSSSPSHTSRAPSICQAGADPQILILNAKRPLLSYFYSPHPNSQHLVHTTYVHTYIPCFLLGTIYYQLLRPHVPTQHPYKFILLDYPCNVFPLTQSLMGTKS